MPHSLFSTDTDLTAENLLRLPAEFGCPVWVYDAQIIRRQIAALKQFDVVRFAQKACSNIHILRLMREQGVKVDSVSLGEIERALAAGYNPQTHPDDIVFTADVIDQATLERVSELQIPVNAGSVDMLDQLGQVSPGHRVWLRVNPGFGHGHSQKTNTGGENSKHGIWYTDLPAALDVIQRHHLQLVGIHMHIGSGVDYAHLEQVCGAMVRQVIEFGQDLQAISAGGGLSVPYQQGEEAVDTEHYYGLWNAAREQIARHLGHPVKLEIEPGRFLVAQSGVLITQVRSVKQMGSRHFVLVDAGFNDLMRPAMYGAYHHITVMGKDNSVCDHKYDITGSLCENNDKFAIDRMLPKIDMGDLLVIHDTGAHGYSMGYNYNGKLKSAEILLKEDGSFELIRRAETPKDYFATFDCFDILKNMKDPE